MKQVTEAIEKAKLEYQSDISWSYYYSDKSTSVHFFYKEDDNTNHIEEIAVFKNGIWIEVVPTDEQVKLMWDKLDKTDYRQSESFEEIQDLYDYNGVKRENFY